MNTSVGFEWLKVNTVVDEQGLLNGYASTTVEKRSN